MAPKTIYTREKIIEAALDVVRDQGSEGLSAQAVAKRLGGSTMPIYVQFPNMVELRKAVEHRCLEILKEYQTAQRTGMPFYDMGLGYVIFAREEKKLFKEIYLPMGIKINEESLNEYLRLMALDPKLKKVPPEKHKLLLKKMLIFVYGLACMNSSGPVLFSPEEEARIIDEVGHAQIRFEIENAEKGVK